MKIKLDTSRCVASGMCAFTAPEVFDQRDDDGVVVLLREEPSEAQHEAVEQAALACPAQVIAIE